jgi:hypothetical protein
MPRYSPPVTWGSSTRRTTSCTCRRSTIGRRGRLAGAAPSGRTAASFVKTAETWCAASTATRSSPVIARHAPRRTIWSVWGTRASLRTGGAAHDISAHDARLCWRLGGSRRARRWRPCVTRAAIHTVRRTCRLMRARSVTKRHRETRTPGVRPTSLRMASPNLPADVAALHHSVSATVFLVVEADVGLA